MKSEKLLFLLLKKILKEEFHIKFIIFLSIAFVLLSLGAFVAASEENSEIAAEQALQKLMDGNARFVSGDALHPNQSAERRAEVVSGQHPFAIIVGCSDSRVPPEIIFDQGIGDIFVIRTAGQVIDNAALASIEYGAEHLGVPLVVVLGHDSCGAVEATVEGGEAPGHIGYLVEAISPAVDEAAEQAVNETSEEELLDAAIDINVKNIVDQLETSEPILSELVEEGRLTIVGARYHLDSGEVEILE
jgi:carbonic anhydrase